jgi:uncharacterized lipoprotein
MKIANAATLAALLILGLVAGCSGNPSQDSQQQGMNPSGTTTQQAPAPVTQPTPAQATHQSPPASI